MKKEHEFNATLNTAVLRILKPLVSLLLKKGMSYTAFAELAKRAFFEVAKSDFALPGKKPTASRISTMTGLSRREVARIDEQPFDISHSEFSNINRAVRVVSGWVRDAAYHDPFNKPVSLPFDGELSFTSLVKKYSGDITPRTIADELSRTHSIKTSSSGLIQLCKHAYIPQQNEVQKIAIFGKDVADLLSTLNHNIDEKQEAYFQRKVAYNFIPEEKRPEVKKKLQEQAQSTLEILDSYLAGYAVCKEEATPGTDYFRVGLGIYYFEAEHRG